MLHVAIFCLAMKHKKLLLAATRKLVERKTAAAHGRSDALEEDISKARNSTQASTGD